MSTGQQRWRQWLGPMLSLVVFAVALVLLHRELEQHSWHDVLRHLRELGSGPVLAAIGCTAGSYLALAFIEALAVRYVGRDTPLRITTAV